MHEESFSSRASESKLKLHGTQRNVLALIDPSCTRQYFPYTTAWTTMKAFPQRLLVHLAALPMVLESVDHLDHTK